MSTLLPSAKALMTHADDPRHIVYATWIIPKFFPYMRDLLNELTKQPAQENFARSLMDAVIAQPNNTGCPCLMLTEKLRTAFKIYGERGMSIADNRAWSAVSVAMIYFILVTDFHFAGPMSDQMKANHLAQLRVLTFAGPKLPAHLLQ
ncbi:hypothetical protein DFH94DRAFT_855158 [Russula ochroleuca]|uniref:Uncharacterized protein n=1 Tax=Russula ochroleuca TaxID=152965 RepID=A0A9P5MSC6_9AGAM|nr:hypothetical protein DFH94DRAFT_855158 [Russula ochroleuca]